MVEFLDDNPFVSVALAQASPQDQAKIAAAIKRSANRDDAPTAQQATVATPVTQLAQLTSQFDVTRIPLRMLMQMQRDPLIGFALFFIRAHLLRARWVIKCPDPQVAGFVDKALREIWPSLVQQYMMKVVFGFQACIKRFSTGQPIDWTYVDPESGDERPVWNEGAVDAVIWKPFVALPPDAVEPKWTSTGEFDGVKYKPALSSNPNTGVTRTGEDKEYDVLHCSPGDELVMTTNRGYVPIEDLDDKTDRLVVWDKKQKRICRHKGFEFKKGSRRYDGDLITVHAGDSAARVTPNHKLTVRWTQEAQNKHAVYLMKKGDWWRIGITRVAREASRSSGLGIRLSAEGGEAAWVLGMFDSKNEALYYERLWSSKYRVPDMVFRTGKWDYASQSEHCLTTEQIESIWSHLDSASGAKRLLADLQLDERYPFLLAGDTSPRGTRGWTCHAANLMSGYMEVPVDVGDGVRAGWETIEITHEHFQGEVYSIDVPPHHHYVSNGVVVQNSLWFTNEKQSVHGSLWGYPRLGYAYRFWWSFWFNWGLADRHFEKDADPPVIVRFPGRGAKTDQDQSNRAKAIAIGSAARSNSTVALPSDPWIDPSDGQVKNVREWDIDTLKGGGNFEVFKDRFAQLQDLMLRAMMVPPEAFEARGGSSGYNSTGQLQETFVMSQIVLISELDFDINRYVIPQIIAANFSDRQVTATKVTKGIDVEDIEFAKMLIQGEANRGSSNMPIDWEELLDSVGIPKLSPAKIAERENQIAEGARRALPESTDPASDQAGVNENGLYYRGRDVINLSSFAEDAERTFFAELTEVAALKDPEVMMHARRMREVWNQALAYDFNVASTLLQDYGANIDLDETFFERFMRRVKGRAHDVAASSRRALESVMRRASTVELERAGLSDFSWDPSNSDRASKFLRERTDVMVNEISETTRNEIRTYLSDLIAKKVPVQDMPLLLRAHFDMFSAWRADRIVRSEISQAYNMAVLLAAEDAGVKQVQAIDAQLGPERSDPHCIERNGKIFTIEQAFKEQLDEHPNGTLQWRLLRKPIRINVRRDPDPQGFLTNFDDKGDHIEVTVAAKLNEQQRNMYLLAIVDRIELLGKINAAEHGRSTSSARSAA